MNNSKAIIETGQTYDADQFDREEYQALETALLQTVRGRNFLTEYLRRNGGDVVSTSTMMVDEGLSSPDVGSDTYKILQAVEKLHIAVMDHQKQPVADHTRMDILEMAKAISKTRSEIAAMRTDGEYDHMSVAAGEMDAIVQSTEKATNDILHAAEKIQEVAWRLREAGTEEAACEEIDNSATEIYMACSFQDITGQRTNKVVRVLQYLEARISSMIEIWGLSEEAELDGEASASDRNIPDVRPDAHLLNGPQMNEDALAQDNIDALLEEESFAYGANEDQPEALQSTSSVELLSEEAIDDIFDAASSDEEVDEEQLKALFN
ncbi:MAG: protein phosphatase CheZ [bacterium]|nr:protein phosphatase CheZ [bacterium]